MRHFNRRRHYGKRTFALIAAVMMLAGFVLCGAVISLGTAFCSIKTVLMWSMPMANSIIWLHFTKYFRQPVVSIYYSIGYLCTFIAALIVFCVAAIKKFNYDNVAEIAT